MTVILNSRKNHPLIATVMVIDDQLTSRIMLETVLQGTDDNIKIKSYDNHLSALKVAEANPSDLILVDYKMPELDDVEFTHRLRTLPDCQDIPIVVITIIDEKSVMYEALEAGATDFLTKPVDHYECKVRCRNLLAMRRQQLIIRNRTSFLETKISDVINEIHVREKETLIRLARASDFKDCQTSLHQIQMRKISSIIVREIGLDSDFCEIVKLAAPLHDIGKIGITDTILLKQGALDSDEMEIMKTHTIMGQEILKDSPSPYLQMGASICPQSPRKI